MTLFRYLLSKLLYDEDEGLHLDEYLVLYELLYSFLESQDQSFLDKWGNSLIESLPFFEEVAKAKEFPVRLRKSIKTEELYSEFLGILVLTKNSYYGMRGNRDMRKSFLLTLNSQLPVQKLKPQRHIGVGYRDKGTRRDPAYDGSPTWQQVASRGNLEETSINLGRSQEPEDGAPFERRGVTSSS